MSRDSRFASGVSLNSARSSECLRGGRPVVLKDKYFDRNGARCHLRVSGIPKPGGGTGVLANARKRMRQPTPTSERDCSSRCETQLDDSEAAFPRHSQRVTSPRFVPTNRRNSPPVRNAVPPPTAPLSFSTVYRTHPPDPRAPLQHGERSDAMMSYSKTSPRGSHVSSNSRSPSRSPFRTSPSSSPRLSPRVPPKSATSSPAACEYAGALERRDDNRCTCPLPPVREESHSFHRTSSPPSASHVTLSANRAPSRGSQASPRTVHVPGSRVEASRRPGLRGAPPVADELFSSESREVVSRRYERRSPLRDGASSSRRTPVTPLAAAASESFARRHEPHVTSSRVSADQ